ncbi:ABC transporter substrate-binding protein [Novosphingobium terrae]|uniref:ABC transporter substrate-binding protein n=1 Tax=Novosphingobium terrae TaxID=2726189 RepID=UPI001F14761F|nr:ABC transporter substrate-binding protein [Novosphingobium terrae]
MMNARKQWVKSVAAVALAVVPVAGMVAVATPAMAQSSDPAAGSVDALNNGLIGIMKAGKGAGQSGRAQRIAPVIDRVFDIPLMTRLAVGPSWNTIAPKDQLALVAGFRNLTIAQFAHNFDDYSGEKFTIAPQVDTRGNDKLVRTTLTIPGHANEQINYRLRQSGGQWKVIDVYFRNSMSQLATRQADFAGSLAKGGAPALIEHLNKLAASPE